MRYTLLALVLTSCTIADDDSYATSPQPPTTPGSEWLKAADPASLGWSNEGLRRALDVANDIGSRAVMVIDDGRLVAAWGDTRGRSYIASIRKSVLSMLIGVEVEGGTISLDATLEELGIDDVDPALNAVEKSASVRDLLTSSSGIYHAAAASDLDELPPRGSSAPGEVFFYNNWDFNALGTIYRQQADIFTSFAARIAAPTGMQDYDPARDGRYELEDVSVHPAYHFDMSARDLARFGLLAMRAGRWADATLIPEAWMHTSTSERIVATSEGSLGYGYMWWVVTDTSVFADYGIPTPAFFANGNLNQFVFVFPTLRLVIVHRGPSSDVDWSEKTRLVRAILEARPGSSAP